jgi:hypothetical protein
VSLYEDTKRCCHRVQGRWDANCRVEMQHKSRTKERHLGRVNKILFVPVGHILNMLMSSSQKTGKKNSIKIANRYFEDVAKFKYLGTTLTDRNCMHEEIKSRLNSGNACSRSVHSLLSSRCCLGT